MSVLSDEGLARRALAVRAGEAQFEAQLARPGIAPVVAPSADPAPFLRGVAAASAPSAALLAEAAVLAGTARARHDHLRWLHTATAPPAIVTPIALDPSVRLERDGHRRVALTTAVEAAERDARDEAIAMVRSLRAAASALDESSGGRATLVKRLGWSIDAREAATAVLAATEDAHRELWRARARDVVGRTVSRVTRADHPALARCERADALIALPDRVGIASRWCERIGVMPEEPAGGLPSAALGPPLTVRWIDAEARPRVLGAPAPDIHGVRSLLGVVGELMATRRASGEGIAAQLGMGRSTSAVAATLARQLLLSAPFLMREAALDRSQVQLVMRELLYAELSELRARATETLALESALDGTAGLGEVIAESYATALGTTVSPELAPFRVCEAFLSQAPRWLDGSLRAPAIATALEREHDEDWFRNPRAGSSFTAAVAAIDAGGDGAALVGAVRRWFDSSGA